MPKRKNRTERTQDQDTVNGKINGKILRLSHMMFYKVR